MKTSFFQDGRHCVGIDYSEREDCIVVCELTDEEDTLIRAGYDIEFLPTNDDSNPKECSIRLFKGPQYKALEKEKIKQDIAKSKEALESRKKEIILELGTLSQEKSGLKIVEADTEEIDARITLLKEEYALINQ